jgi:hypothetical protein
MFMAISALIVALGLTISNTIQTLALSGYKLIKCCSVEQPNQPTTDQPNRPTLRKPTGLHEHDVIELYER